jgi:CDP-diacylglycerol pyrophosphatase
MLGFFIFCAIRVWQFRACPPVYHRTLLMGEQIWSHVNAKLSAFLLVGLGICAAVAVAPAAFSQRAYGDKSKSSTDSPIDPSKPSGRGALRQIVQGQCVLNWQQHHNPAPCIRVFLADPRNGNSGYALLADPAGGAHYLLVPTLTMTGLESRELLDPDAPNYFAQAWQARDLITAFVGHEVPRTAVGLVSGIAQTRNQDQFHIHIECLRQDVAKALRASANDVTEAWSPLTVAGSIFQAQRILADGLDGSNVFELLATLKPDARHHMSEYTLIAAGMQFKDGPGFVVLAGTGPSGEILFDSTCAVAGAGG